MDYTFELTKYLKDEEIPIPSHTGEYMCIQEKRIRD